MQRLAAACTDSRVGLRSLLIVATQPDGNETDHIVPFLHNFKQLSILSPGTAMKMDRIVHGT